MRRKCGREKSKALLKTEALLGYETGAMKALSLAEMRNET
jgi:hypothetical protein